MIQNQKLELNRLMKFAIVVLAYAVVSTFSLSVKAIELNVSAHQGNESDMQGLSLLVSDRFSKGGNLYWNIGYSSLDDVKVEWNNSDLFFQVDTIDTFLSYRYTPKTFNKFLKQLSFEYQLGASVVLTENKFIWEELDEEKYFSESNDINALAGFTVHYNTSNNTAINVGFKYQPSFSEFDDITSVYFGFTYKFGNQQSYSR